MNICSECKHHINDKSAFNSKVWYNHLCGAITHNSRINCVTGEEKYFTEGVNSFGKEYIVDAQHPHPYCKDVNKNGNCKYYEEDFSNVKPKDITYFV